MSNLKDYYRDDGVYIPNLLLNNYQKLLISPEEMMLWIHLAGKQRTGDFFPDLSQIAETMGIPQERVFLLLNQLVGKKMIEIITTDDANGRSSDQYDLSLIFDRLEENLAQQADAIKEQAEESKVAGIYQSFEEEFGRPLSPIEYQRIGQWLEEDSYQPELIQLALREAVLNQAYNLNYVDRILLAWQKKNITTKAQVQQEQQKRKDALLKKEAPELSREPLPKVSLHNWLKEEPRD
ncbi:DnaD domain-containing protein [Enterococcus sp. HY326]|uniref:DnaD domain-containing protein n=1 Tax=Enterococcus sp. HY326 TaxID=2971265 RepID=UPI00223F6629|nr:DnaD domain protein [Enterococcus sp. HY326]